MPRFALTQHDEDLMQLPAQGSYDDTVQQIEGMDEMSDPTVQRAYANGVPMCGMGADAAPSSGLSLKTIITLVVLGLGGWWLYKKMGKK